MMNKYFETIKILNGEVYNIFYHQKRYERIVSNPKKLITFLGNRPHEGLYRAKLVYKENGDIENVNYFLYKKREIQSLKLLEVDRFDYSKKFLNRDILDVYFRNRDSCDDVVFVIDGKITDTTIANIAFLKEGIWYTPKNPLLPGTTRERLLETGSIQIKDIYFSDIFQYEKIALLNAMIGFDIIQQKDIREIFC